MIKVITFIIFAFVMTNIAQATECTAFLQQVQANQQTISMLKQEITLQSLDINSYNPSQKETPEYIERVATYNVLSENFNAIVANHNNMVTIYKAECE
jgi:hypothetical protein